MPTNTNIKYTPYEGEKYKIELVAERINALLKTLDVADSNKTLEELNAIIETIKDWDDSDDSLGVKEQLINIYNSMLSEDEFNKLYLPEIDENIANVNGKVDALETQMGNVEDKISEVNNNISEEVNGRVDADNLLEKRIDNIKYYGDADANPTPDDWFTFSDEAHTILTGLAGGHYYETDIVIPNTVTTIDSGAFSGCSSLTSITIPNSVTTIGSGAFNGCSSLTSVTIPNSVTIIKDGAFYGCSSLTSVTIPNTVTIIDTATFASCENLTSVTIPNSVTSIGGHAFYNCSSLTSITIPNSVTSIGSGAFSDCENLTSITIPNSVTSTDTDVFENTGNLTIYCSQHSYADTFAQTNRIPVKYTEVIDGLGGFWGLDLPLIKTITLEESVTSIDILSKAEGIELQEFTVLLFIKYLGDAIEDNSISNCIVCLRANGGSNYFGYKGGYSFFKDKNSFAFWHTKIYNKQFALTDLYSGRGNGSSDIPYQGFQGIDGATPTQYSAYTSFNLDAVDNLNVFISNSDVSKGAIIPQGSMIFLLGR